MSYTLLISRTRERFNNSLHLIRAALVGFHFELHRRLRVRDRAVLLVPIVFFIFFFWPYLLIPIVVFHQRRNPLWVHQHVAAEEGGLGFKLKMATNLKNQVPKLANYQERQFIGKKWGNSSHWPGDNKHFIADRRWEIQSDLENYFATITICFQFPMQLNRLISSIRFPGNSSFAN